MVENYINKVIWGDALATMRAFPNACVDAVITDIPYNISQEHGGLREIDYGEWDKNITIGTVNDWVDEMARLTKGSLYIFCADQQFSHIFTQLEKLGFIVRKYEWLKTNPNVMNGQNFWLSSGELCVCAKLPSSYYNGNCEKAYKVIGAPTGRVHPTQKPIELMNEFIVRSVPEGGIVLDPFAGSGTTLRACKDQNRNYIGIETDEKYVAICNERLAQDLLF